MTTTTTASPEQILKKARTRFSQAEIATICARDTRTVRRWENGEVEPPALIVPALREALATGKAAGGEDFTFVDLFAGIGGIRLGFEAIGGKCVFTSEWNQWAVKTYTQNHGGEGHQFNEDITKITKPKTEIPKHDVLLAGFPCQPFSIAGVSKKNSLGRPHGFECLTQGTLFYDVARVIAAHRPAAFLLENVKNLMSHDKGNTFRTIMDVLEDELKYKIHYKVIDGKHWTPQHRERIVIVGFRETVPFSWDALKFPEKAPLLRDILHKEDGSEVAPAHDGERFINAKGKVQPKYVLTEHLWTYLQNYKKKHEAAGNGFGFGLVTPDQTSRTLSARYFKDGSEILISRGKGKRPRRLTPRECARLMGFPDSFEIPVSDTQAYKQFGNSVVVPVMREAARLMKPGIMAIKEQTNQPDLLAA